MTEATAGATRVDGVGITGVGETALGRHPGMTSMDLYVASAVRAIKDAGLRNADIDGVVTAGSRTDGTLMHSLALAENLGLEPRLAATLALGGAAHCAAIQYAALAVANGAAAHVLVAAGDNILTGLLSADPVARVTATGAGHPEFENPVGLSIPSLYALIARRHMYEFGTTPEQLASVSVAMRRRAHRNPNAHLRDLIDIDEVLNSRMISDPLHLLDCCPLSDGAGAFIVSRRSATDQDSRRPKSVPVLATAQAHGSAHLTLTHDLTTTECVRAAANAFRACGLTPADIDLAFVYDSFTIAAVILLEDLGFCAKGDGGPFVEQLFAEHAGAHALSVNTHGGLMSHGHPGKAGGIFHVIEAVRQLRRDAGDRQVDGASCAIVHGSGGALAAHSVAILGGIDA